MTNERIQQLARSYADTLGRSLEQAGGKFNYDTAANEIARAIRQALEEQARQK